MRRLVVKILKNETILVVASILALISCFIVPPDKEYAGYIHASTISQLICLMLVVCGFQRIGVFRNIDWGLPLTFCMFFIFIGNMKRVPEFYELAASSVGAHPLEVSVVSSQFISNVPTTLLLSGFCDQWRALIIGTNLGGMGTLIASMASLIGYKNVTRKYPDKKGRYLAVYSAVNVLFLIVLVGLSWIIEP